jgi:methionyl-tRNA synthetase
MKFYLTTPIYYINDKPHLGHAYCTLAADVLARYHRQKGDKMFFLTGTDEHGAKVVEAATKMYPKERDYQITKAILQKFCDQISEEFKKTWKNLNISYDYFIRTTDAVHQKIVENFLLKLKEKRAVYQGEYEGLYCTGCEKFLTEKELVDGLCLEHQKSPEKVKEKNYFFALKKYLPKIKKLIEKDEIKILPLERKAETLGLFKQDLDDFSLSREKVEWGIPMPWDKTQTVYVWVDALLNYLSGSIKSQIPNDKLQINSKFKIQNSKPATSDQQPATSNQYWPPDLQLIGKDILKFHTIYWPAMLLAAGLELPKKIFIHGFFTINNQKMSKALGNVIDPNDLIKKFGLDATRYLILSQFPFGADGDISWQKLIEKYNADLANGLGNLVARVVTMVGKYQSVLSLRGVPTLIGTTKQSRPIPITMGLPRSPHFFRKKCGVLAMTRRKYEKAFTNLQLYEALKIVWEFISHLDKYIDQEKPWVLIKKKKVDELEEILYNLKVGLKEITFLIQPFMPGTAQRIRDGLKGGKKEVLFPRINS